LWWRRRRRFGDGLFRRHCGGLFPGGDGVGRMVLRAARPRAVGRLPGRASGPKVMYVAGRHSQPTPEVIIVWGFPVFAASRPPGIRPSVAPTAPKLLSLFRYSTGGSRSSLVRCELSPRHHFGSESGSQRRPAPVECEDLVVGRQERNRWEESCRGGGPKMLETGVVVLLQCYVLHRRIPDGANPGITSDAAPAPCTSISSPKPLGRS
jgi:hypothetical protein